MKTILDISNYIFLESPLEEADIIFIPGGSYPELGEKSAELWTQGYAPLVLPSGKYSPSKERFSGVSSKKERYSGDYDTEWKFFKDVLIKNGVAEGTVLREDTAEYTYQNAFKSREVTDRLDLQIKKTIICCKSFHARRCYTYYQWAYPEAELIMIPCDVQDISKENWFCSEQGIDRVMGELTRCGNQFKHYIMELTKEI